MSSQFGAHASVRFESRQPSIPPSALRLLSSRDVRSRQLPCLDVGLHRQVRPSAAEPAPNRTFTPTFVPVRPPRSLSLVSASASGSRRRTRNTEVGSGEEHGRVARTMSREPPTECRASSRRKGRRLGLDLATRSANRLLPPRGRDMTRRKQSTWRRISARLPEITLAIAVAATLCAAVWAAWRVGWL
jgi:hypothetical protein